MHEECKVKGMLYKFAHYEEHNDFVSVQWDECSKSSNYDVFTNKFCKYIVSDNKIYVVRFL